MDKPLLGDPRAVVSCSHVLIMAYPTIVGEVTLSPKDSGVNDCLCFLDRT
jgi:hypothetical protein